MFFFERLRGHFKPRSRSLMTWLWVPILLFISYISYYLKFLSLYNTYNMSYTDDVWWFWLSEVAQSCPTFVTPQTVAYQAPPSMGFSRQEYRSGVPLPSPGDLPDQGIEPRSPSLQADAFNCLTHQGSDFD